MLPLTVTTHWVPHTVVQLLCIKLGLSQGQTRPLPTKGGAPSMMLPARRVIVSTDYAWNGHDSSLLLVVD
jgi:hypothetical protein